MGMFVVMRSGFTVLCIGGAPMEIKLVLADQNGVEFWVVTKPNFHGLMKIKKKKVQYDLKAKNIITSALGNDELFRVSNCKSAKEMWDTLEIMDEGTEEDKRISKEEIEQRKQHGFGETLKNRDILSAGISNLKIVCFIIS
ncbi:hypothetical protein Lal_00037723 [Lupinus albus]|nr:hypothetical protein Lal_00037723 [Lupinus albus]